MADDDDDAFTFGDFTFISSSPTTQNDNVFNDFFFSPSSQSIKPNLDPFSIRSDPGSNPRKVLPLSLFDEFDDKDETFSKSNGDFDTNLNKNDDFFGKFDGSMNKIDDEDWEFKGADFNNNFVGNYLKVNGVEHEKQAGQDASISNGYEPGPTNSMPRYIDLFAPYNGAVHKSGEVDLGFDFSSTTVATNGFISVSIPGSKEFSNGNGPSANLANEDDDFDDFGDFVDASQKVQPEEQVFPQTETTEELFHNNTIQDKQTKQENNGGALPLSLFSDLTEEFGDSLNYQDNVIHKPVSHPGNGSSSQGSGISIHDLISNLYSQAPQTSSVDSSNQNRAGIAMHSDESDDNDDWNDSSWEFKDAFSEQGVKEQSQKSTESSSNPQFYTEFYATLREALCFLLSHQLKEVQEAQCSGSVIVDDGKAEAPGSDIQEAYKLLQHSMIDKEAFSKKHVETSTCLNEVLEALQDPKFKVIESEYSLSKRLQLAANEWRVATELLRHVISVLHILSLGSSDDHRVYVTTWSKLINVCNEELKYGSLIWKKASEKNLQHQILSDHQGQQYIQALGEIFKVVKLLGLSAKFYKPWMLLSATPDVFGPFDECHTLWSSSGLEQALQDISENVDFGWYGPAKALIASVKKICDLGAVEVHDHVFIQQKSLCRLSLLPLKLLADMKMVLWNEQPYFVNLANLWSNLINSNPPELPHLQVTQENGHHI